MSKKMKKTRTALLMSAMSLVLCFSMLLGTTYAWFTDNSSTAVNKIQAGILDVAIVDANGNSLEGDTLEFVDANGDVNGDVNVLWEPNATFNLEEFCIQNKGNLALKYKLAINGVDGESELLDVIDFTVSIGSNKDIDLETFEWHLEPGEMSSPVKISGHMDKDAGNEYQGLSIDGLGITVYATQWTSEVDSYNDQYDKNAEYSEWDGSSDTSWYDPSLTTFYINTAEDLAGLAEIVNSGVDTFAGDTVILNENIDLNNIPWTPIGISENGWDSKFNGSFNGNGFVIKNLYIEGTSGLGLFGYVGNAAHIENVHIDGAYVSGTDYVGAVVGTGYLAANCLKNNTVENATIIATPYWDAEKNSYDGGAKAGAVAGYVINGNITGNKAINCKVTAYRDIGGIVGMAAGENRDIVVENNTVENVRLYIDDSQDYKGYNGDVDLHYIKPIVGRINDNVAIGDNLGDASTGSKVVVSTASDLATNLEAGNYVTLTNDVTAPLASTAIYGTSVAAIQKGGVLDGNGYSLDIENPKYEAYAIETYGGTIQNLTIDSTVGRGIVISSPKEDIYIDNVVIDGPGYAINTTEYSAKKLIVSNSTINGWSSFAGLESASFTNCSFGENSAKYWQGMGYDEDYDRLIKPYVNTQFTNCTFEQNFYIDLSALGSNCAVALDQCNVDGTILTAENYDDYITVELPEGRTIADCIIFK